MNKIIIFLIILTLALTACNEKQQLIIDGTVNTKKDFNGEMLYLISMDAVRNTIIDSVAIKDSTFSVSVLPSDSFSIVRITPKNAMLSYFMQPLLVVVEPGHLKADLNYSSSSQGTPLNDRLQLWKERREAGEQPSQFAEYNYSFIKDNKDNALGKFFYSVFKENFTPEQLETLNIE